LYLFAVNNFSAFTYLFQFIAKATLFSKQYFIFILAFFQWTEMFLLLLLGKDNNPDAQNSSLQYLFSCSTEGHPHVVPGLEQHDGE